MSPPPAPDTPATPAPARPRSIFKLLYVQVLIGIILGGLLGYLQPAWGVQLRPLGDAFIKLMRMLIAPIIFTTVVVGFAGMGDLKKIGRVGGKAVLYFEIVTTLALIIGLVVANVFKPGEGIHANVATLDTKAVASYAQAAEAPEHGRFPAQHHPEHLCRCVRPR
jgi:aerobic C4-dicarboxylate transport protein